MVETGKVQKAVGATWPVGFRYRGDDLNSLLITGVAVTSLPAGLTVDAGHIDADGKGVWALVSGGVVDTDYFVAFAWTRSDGMITPDIMRVAVR
ncbi:MAG TPA: hypothetical protein VNA25_25880 [Phycisphaerae bacterium]|nr:hypothetical protein [Phycisphaerae bacterium]